MIYCFTYNYYFLIHFFSPVRLCQWIIVLFKSWTCKLLVSIREIFLNDKHDVEYSNTIYEQSVKNIMDIEKGIGELRFKADVANGKEKKELQGKIKKAEDSVEAMKIAMKNLRKFMSSFEAGFNQV